MHELQRVLERQVREFAGGVLCHPQSSALNRSPEANMSVRLRRHTTASKYLPVLRLPAPMRSRPGPLPVGAGWSFEPKYDGFRAVISTENGLRVRSRRGWDMTPALPELENLPAGLVLDGELVAWKGHEPHFPALCRRMLNGDTSI